MTVGEYISGELAPFFVEASVSLDMFLFTIDLNETYSASNEKATNVALLNAIERVMLRPRVEQVNENGFSATIKFDDMGKYYAYLCKRYGVTPNADIVAGSGVSVIKEISNRW